MLSGLLYATNITPLQNQEGGFLHITLCYKSSDNRTLFEVENAYNKPPPPSACIGLLNKVNFAQIKKIFYLGEIDLI